MDGCLNYCFSFVYHFPKKNIWYISLHQVGIELTTPKPNLTFNNLSHGGRCLKLLFLIKIIKIIKLALSFNLQIFFLSFLEAIT